MGMLVVSPAGIKLDGPRKESDVAPGTGSAAGVFKVITILSVSLLTSDTRNAGPRLPAGLLESGGLCPRG